MEKPLLDCIFSLLFLLPFVLYVCTVSVPFLVVLSMLSVGTCIKLTFYLLGFSVTGFSLSLSPPLWDQLPFPSQILCCQLLLCLPRLHASGVLLPPPPRGPGQPLSVAGAEEEALYHSSFSAVFP